MGPHRWKRTYDKAQLSTVTTPQDIASSASRLYSAPSETPQSSQSAASSQLRESASKDWLRSKKLFAESAPISKKTSAKPRRDWGYQSERSTKAKISIVAGVLALFVIVAASIFLILNPDAFPRAVATLPKPELPKSEASKPSPPKPPVAEVAPPVISNISDSEVTESSVVITWITNEKATSQVEYGTTTSYGRASEPDAELVTEHRVKLSALNPSATYYYRVKSKSANGKLAESSTDRTFTTTAPPDTTPPVIAGIKITDVSDSTVTIAWATDEKATSQVEYGMSASYGATTSADENLVTNHSVTINGLEADKTYYFRVKSRDAKKNEAAVDASQPFRTQPPVPTGPEVGKRAPDFTVYTMDGAPVTLSKLRGKVVMVNFWAIGCGACVAEMPDIEAVYKTWSGPKEIRILAINAGDHSIYIRNFIEEEKMTLPIYVDSDRTAVKDYQIYRIPRTFFIDSRGIIRKIELGRFDNQEQIKEALNSLQ